MFDANFATNKSQKTDSSSYSILLSNKKHEIIHSKWALNAAKQRSKYIEALAAASIQNTRERDTNVFEYVYARFAAAVA